MNVTDRTHSGTLQARRVRTERSLIEAFGALLAEKGFAAVGMRAVAGQAGVNKTLIYRYFGGLEGLARAYAGSVEYWPTLEEAFGAPPAEIVSLPAVDRWFALADNYPAAIRKRPQTVEILAWETIERNAITIALEEPREQFGLELVKTLQQGVDPSVDIAALLTIAAGTYHYFAVRSCTIDTYNGIDITSEKGVNRLTEMLRRLGSVVLGDAAHNTGEKDGTESRTHR
ncbi:MAG: TetR/AcrR family transcriptional regulator [Spirochaetales bacterium]|nr:TetR/AcrR family transcriptional regulator [Spirochaetales bacterium]